MFLSALTSLVTLPSATETCLSSLIRFAILLAQLLSWFWSSWLSLPLICSVIRRILERFLLSLARFVTLFGEGSFATLSVGSFLLCFSLNAHFDFDF